MKPGAAILAMGCILAVGASCRRSDLTGPPELRLGRDECDECGMIVSEDRCSSAMLIEKGGTREQVRFDDIGCMLDYEQAHANEMNIIDRFVHDHASRGWVAAGQAVFLRGTGEQPKTPMGSRIVAFAKREDAERALTDAPGDLLDFAALAKSHREGGVGPR